MKSNIKLLLLILIAAFVSMVEVASAFYDPGLQRWINRDPLSDHGSLAHKSTASMPSNEAADTRGELSRQAEDSWMKVNRNVFGFLANSPLTWIDPLGFVIKCSGPDKEKWEKLLDNWRKNLPKESPLRKVVDDLDKSKDTVTIEPLTGKKDGQGKQVPIPFTEKTPLGNNRIAIDFGKNYNYDNNPANRNYSNPEALAHEMLHAHDNLIDKNYRGHGEGFWDEEKPITNDAKTCP